MRIRLKTAVGQYRTGEILDTDYTMGANLCFFGHAEQMPDEPEGKAVEAPPRDKMIRKPKARHKAAGQRGASAGRNEENQDA